MEALWTELAGEDARRPHLAIRKLGASPRQTVPFLQERLRPIPEPPPERIARLVRDLGSDKFAPRAQATKELERLGELAEPALRQALEGRNPSLELRRRLERLLEKTYGPVVLAEALQRLRAVAALEAVGTPEAARILEAVARGARAARLTREARGALERLERRRPRLSPR